MSGGEVGELALSCQLTLQVWHISLPHPHPMHYLIPSVSLGLYPNNVGELVSWWVRLSIGATEGMIMSSTTVQTTLSCMGELVLLQLQNTGFVAIRQHLLVLYGKKEVVSIDLNNHISASHGSSIARQCEELIVRKSRCMGCALIKCVGGAWNWGCHHHRYVAIANVEFEEISGTCKLANEE